MRSGIVTAAITALTLGTSASAQGFEYDGTIVSLTYAHEHDDFRDRKRNTHRVSSTTAFSYDDVLGEVFLAYTNQKFGPQTSSEAKTTGLRLLYQLSDAFAVGVYGHYNDTSASLFGGVDDSNVSRGIEVRGTISTFTYNAFAGRNAKLRGAVGGYDNWHSAGLNLGHDLSDNAHVFFEAQRDYYYNYGSKVEVDAFRLGLTYDIGSLSAAAGQPIYLTGELSRFSSALSNRAYAHQVALTVSIPLGGWAAKPPAFRGARNLFTSLDY